MDVAGSGFRIRVPLQLADDEVQVWRVELDVLAPSEPHWLSLLAPDEQDRARRFRFDRHRRRFATTRGVLRTLLGSYLNAEPRSVRFRYSDKQKPALDAAFAQGCLQFNVSHSEELALLAFTRAREIGVDVERVRENSNIEGIAKHFFSESEREALASLPASEKQAAFYRCWTRKEAFIKAIGEGMSLPLHQFDVSLAPGQPAELLATRPDPEEKKRWSVWTLDAGAEFAAALVVEDKDKDLRVVTALVSSVLEAVP
jgi:4'-phosphopantetheinyl transferase